MRALGDLAARAAEDVRIEELVGDERARPGVVLGAPLRRDAVAVLGLEPGALQGHVGENRHHVDHEGVALRAVQRIAPRLVDEREEITGDVKRVGIAACLASGAIHHPEQLAESRDGLRRSREIPVALLSGDDHHRRAVPRDIDRYAMYRREHRLQRRQALLSSGEALAGPELVEGVDRRGRSRSRLIGGIGDPHLAETKRKRRAQAEADA